MKVTIESEALDSLKAMVEQLQSERDELLKCLVDCEEALSHLEERMYVRVNPPTLENAQKTIAKCTAKPEVMV